MPEGAQYPAERRSRCRVCSGYGQVQTEEGEEGDRVYQWLRCPSCGGTGFRRGRGRVQPPTPPPASANPPPKLGPSVAELVQRFGIYKEPPSASPPPTYEKPAPSTSMPPYKNPAPSRARHKKPAKPIPQPPRRRRARRVPRFLVSLAMLLVGAVAYVGLTDPTMRETYGDQAWAQIAAIVDAVTPDGRNAAVAPPTQQPMAVQGALTPTPQRVVPPPERHIKEKRYMLELINAERLQAGLGPVVLGDNVAAQLHAEASLDGCFSSHWGIDGLKPYMRYSLAGGYQSNGENGHGIGYCIESKERLRYRPIADVDHEIREAMEGWMDSPGHRRNILRPWHKKVNIGLAWDTHNFNAIQHFEGDYVEYDRLPSIDRGILSLAGTAKNGAGFTRDRDLGVQVYYDPPPHALTRGQVVRTYCYDLGLRIVSLRSPPGGNASYSEDTYTTPYDHCPDPYDVPADAPGPRSLVEAHALWQKAYNASQNRKNLFIAVPWVTAREWMARDRSFAVKADIGDLLAQHGSGVYSLTVWGSVGGEGAVISQYSIFHNVAPPDTYTTDARVGPGSSPQEAATGLEDQRTPAPSTTYLEPAPTTLTVGERMEVVLRSNRDSLYLTHGTSIGIGQMVTPTGSGRVTITNSRGCRREGTPATVQVARGSAFDVIGCNAGRENITVQDGNGNVLARYSIQVEASPDGDESG